MTTHATPPGRFPYELTEPLSLVGLPGCGKSTVGKKLAAMLQAPFVDVDSNVEVKQGASVAQIFAQSGEEEFRRLEREMIAYFLYEAKPMVLATGGGAFMCDETREILKEFTLTVWIKPPFDLVLERVSRRNTRPLLEGGDKRQKLIDLMNVRYPIYAEAEIIVETPAGSFEEAAKAIIDALVRHGKP
ncbi:MAG: shikimate kinase [Rickettsiales bacterium]